jgi:hypothetical protein
MQELCDADLLPEGPGILAYKHLLRAWDESEHPEKHEYVTKLTGKVRELQG